MRRRDLLAILGGMAGGWPLLVRAQQKPMAVVGFLGDSSLASAGAELAAFREGLRETGFVEEKNLTIDYRWAEGRFDQLATLAKDLVERKVDVIATAVGLPAALAAKSATLSIPIVFSVGVDPVSNGLVASLARPDGNLTGVTVFGGPLDQKRLELLSELLPKVGVIGILVNPSNPASRNQMAAQSFESLEQTAHARGAGFYKLTASTESEIDAAFMALPQSHIGALIVAADPFFRAQRSRIAALATSYGVPTISSNRGYVEAGGLMSYGPSTAASYRQAGIYTGRILKGDKPGDLPVQQPAKFELVLNLQTAKQLGLTVPQPLLARADEVIE